MSDRFVRVAIDGLRHLVRVSDVEEIVSLRALTHVERGRSRFRGMANLRGELLPVFDLTSPTARLSPSRFVLVARSTEGPVGLIVDEVHDVIVVDHDSLAHRPIGAGRTATVARVEDEVLSVLEVSHAIDDEQ
jgi:purine-binding chemotaxis protein CheW